MSKENVEMRFCTLKRDIAYTNKLKLILRLSNS